MSHVGSKGQGWMALWRIGECEAAGGRAVLFKLEGATWPEAFPLPPSRMSPVKVRQHPL